MLMNETSKCILARYSGLDIGPEKVALAQNLCISKANIRGKVCARRPHLICATRRSHHSVTPWQRSLREN